MEKSEGTYHRQLDQLKGLRRNSNRSASSRGASEAVRPSPPWVLECLGLLHRPSDGQHNRMRLLAPTFQKCFLQLTFEGSQTLPSFQGPSDQL